MDREGGSVRGRRRGYSTAALLTGFLLMLVTGGMIEAAIGTMQAIREFKHQAG